ncbi:hypothetical protein OEJ37_16795 [Burkholderia sp. BKH01]|nr:hypothetical protein [Burkholderia sp. BKH01]MCU9955017.1 hypothetical protein [Burkholderia sp. BKH01]
MSVRLRLGFERCPLMFRHVPAQNDRARDDGAGFDAAVGILPVGH